MGTISVDLMQMFSSLNISPPVEPLVNKPLGEYFPPNFKVYEFDAGENRASKEVSLDDIADWLRFKENGGFVFQCLLCNQEMNFSIVFCRGDYIYSRSHLLTKKHKTNVAIIGSTVGLLFNSPQKFVMCSARDLQSGSVLENMRRVSRRDISLPNTKILNQVFCREYKMFSFNRKTKKLSEFECQNDIVLFMKTEVRPLFTMYCLFCNHQGASYTQVVQHLNSRKHRKKMGPERGVILAVRDFNVFIACSFDKLSSLLYLTHQNSYLEEIVVAGEGSIVISGFLTNEGKSQPKKDGVSIIVDPILLPNGQAKNESIRIKTRFQNFLDKPETSESEPSLIKSNISNQKNVTIYEFSSNSFNEYYADNMLFSLFSSGSRIWCTRCSLPIYTLEAMENHLSSSQHASRVRNNEQLGFMCHVCNVFYIELKGETLAHVHSSKNNKQILKSLVPINREAIGYNTPLNQNIMKAYSHLFAGYNEACKFCCLGCADLTKKKLMHLGNHETEEKHRKHVPTDLYFVLCEHCNVIFIDKGSDGNCPDHFFKGHFATHLSIQNPILFKVFQVDGDSVNMSMDITKLEPKMIKSTSSSAKVKVKCSRFFSQFSHPGICSKEFIKNEEWSKEDCSHYIRSLNALTPITYACFACSRNDMTNSDFINHILTHTQITSFIKFCNICSVIIVSSSLLKLQEHFLSQRHTNKLLVIADVTPEGINISKEKLYNCASLFSTEEILTNKGNNLLNEMKKVWNEHNRKFEEINADLRNCLSALPNLKIELFGSQLSGLALSGSDCDICLNIGIEHFNEVRELLDLAARYFKVLVSLPDTRVPIIKVIHLGTKLSCDISFSSKWERHSSKLVKLFIDFDERVHWMLAIVREWFKTVNLKTGQFFSSPSINWLVLFYLMQPDVRVVPRVSQVIDAIGSKDKLLSEGLKLNWKEKSLNLTCSELLVGFFHYYALMNFSTNKLCPLSGLVIPREPTSPDQSPIFIEDPFYLNNLTDRITLQVLHEFQSLCYLTLHMSWRVQ